jgi:predicted N-acyltransferase
MTDVIELAWLDRLDEVEAATWDAVAARGSFYSSHGYLRSLERASTYSFAYLVARRDGALVGGLPYYRLDAPDLPVNHAFDPPRALLGDAAPGSWYPAVLLGTRSGYGARVGVAGDLDDDVRARVRAALITAALDRAASEARSVTAMYVPAGRRADFAALEEHPGAVAAACKPVACIDVGGRTFDDYVASFTHARDFRRDRQRFDATGWTIEDLPLSSVLDEAGRLVGAVHERHGHPDAAQTMTARYAALDAALPGAGVGSVALDGGTPVAIAVSFAWDGALYAWGWGCQDWAAARKGAAYFNLVFYHRVELALRLGLRTIDLGPDAYAAKLWRGAKPAPRWSVTLPPADATDWRATLDDAAGWRLSSLDALLADGTIDASWQAEA